MTRRTLLAAEFFAGMGLVRCALERVDAQVVFANDIEPFKASLYGSRFGLGDFLLGDIRRLSGDDIPDVDLATASFPCTDLSLAGRREGLAGQHSGLFWEFLRVLDGMEYRRPPVILLENVPSLATSHAGADLAALIGALNKRGFACDLLSVDARHFVPQSRERLFVVAFPKGGRHEPQWLSSPADRARPPWLRRFVDAHADLDVRLGPLPALGPRAAPELEQVLEALDPDDGRWWEPKRRTAFTESLSQRNMDRLRSMELGSTLSRATAFRRTRGGRAVWEIRSDGLSGCLRTARGGSSRQVIVEAGLGTSRIRWMTASECARLQGAPDFPLGAVSENQALFALGDAVCVPAVEWVLRHAVLPRVAAEHAESRLAATA